MHVVVINQFFWPDTAATGQLLTDVTRAIDPSVHSVTALCSTSKYGTADLDCAPQVEILRSGGVAFSRGKIGRLVSYGTFFVGATINGLRGPKPTVILTLTTPPLISLVGTMIKSFRGSKHFIWEMDLYPDIAVDLKVMKAQSIVARLVGVVADFSRRRADGIIALGDDMKSRIMARGVPEHKIFVAENWADGCEIPPTPFEDGPFVVHYSGTFGLAHEEHTITQAMRQLRGDNRFRFIFVGGGARRERLEEFCLAEGIHTAEFRPYAKRSELGRSLAEGHVGLVTQISETMGAVVPSKIYGIMAAARPVLFVGPHGATPSTILERHGCGWRVEPGDTTGLLQLLKRLEHDRGIVREAGARARLAFEKYYDKPIGVARILAILGVPKTSRSVAESVGAASTA